MDLCFVYIQAFQESFVDPLSFRTLSDVLRSIAVNDTLDLSQYSFNKAGIKTIMRAIAESKTLVSVEMGKNRLSNRTARILATLSRNNTSLRQFSGEYKKDCAAEFRNNYIVKMKTIYSIVEYSFLSLPDMRALPLQALIASYLDLDLDKIFSDEQDAHLLTNDFVPARIHLHTREELNKHLKKNVKIDFFLHPCQNP